MMIYFTHWRELVSISFTAARYQALFLRDGDFAWLDDFGLAFKEAAARPRLTPRLRRRAYRASTAGQLTMRARALCVMPMREVSALPIYSIENSSRRQHLSTCCC